MQFLVIAYDGTDDDAPARRAAHREAHFAGLPRLFDAGHLLTGGAMLNDDGVMIGSTAIMDFPSRADLDAWLASEPYVTGGVWRDITVHPFKVAGRAIA